MTQAILLCVESDLTPQLAPRLQVHTSRPIGSVHTEAYRLPFPEFTCERIAMGARLRVSGFGYSHRFGSNFKRVRLYLTKHLGIDSDRLYPSRADMPVTPQFGDDAYHNPTHEQGNSLAELSIAQAIFASTDRKRCELGIARTSDQYRLQVAAFLP